MPKIYTIDYDELVRQLEAVVGLVRFSTPEDLRTISVYKLMTIVWNIAREKEDVYVP